MIHFATAREYIGRLTMFAATQRKIVGSFPPSEPLFLLGVVSVMAGARLAGFIPESVGLSDEWDGVTGGTGLVAIITPLQKLIAKQDGATASGEGKMTHKPDLTRARSR
jgi:hypothetical protein